MKWVTRGGRWVARGMKWVARGGRSVAGDTAGLPLASHGESLFSI